MPISVLLPEPEAVIHDVLTKTIVVLFLCLQDFLSFSSLLDLLPDTDKPAIRSIDPDVPALTHARRVGAVCHLVLLLPRVVQRRVAAQLAEREHTRALARPSGSPDGAADHWGGRSRTPFVNRVGKLLEHCVCV